MAFSLDGKTLTTSSSEEKTKVWEVSSGHCLQTVQGHAHTNWTKSVAFSPDGSLLATASDDQTVKVWEVNSGQCLNTLDGHVSRVWSLAFSPTKSILASGSDNGTILLWDVQTGSCLKTLRSERPYERMNIYGVTGITEAQKASLKELGAIEAVELLP